MFIFTFLVISANRTFERVTGPGRSCSNLALRVIVSTGTQRKDVALDIVARIRVPSACTLIRDRLVCIATRGRGVVPGRTLTLVVLARMNRRDGDGVGDGRHVGQRCVDGGGARGSGEGGTGGRRRVVENSAERHGAERG